MEKVLDTRDYGIVKTVLTVFIHVAISLAFMYAGTSPAASHDHALYLVSNENLTPQKVLLQPKLTKKTLSSYLNKLDFYYLHKDYHGDYID